MLQPVEYVIKALTNKDGRWGVSEIELLRVIYTVTYFRQFLQFIAATLKQLYKAMGLKHTIYIKHTFMEIIGPYIT